MSGQRKSSKEKDALIYEYLEKNDIYSPKRYGYKVDFKGYAAFIRDNNISFEDITPEMAKPFMTKI